MRAGKLRVQRHRFGEFIACAGEICRLYFGAAEHQVRFSRFTIPQNAIDESLSFFNLVIANQGGAEQVHDRHVVRVFLGFWAQQTDHIFVLPHAQIAIPEQQDRLDILRFRFVDPEQVIDCVRNSSRFVISQGQVQTEAGSGGGLL